MFGGPEVLEVASLRVFDRWGGLAYAATGLPPDGTKGWDGTVAGKPMNPGVYVFLATVVFLDGSEQRVSGEVVLVR